MTCMQLKNTYDLKKKKLIHFNTIRYILYYTGKYRNIKITSIYHLLNFISISSITLQIVVEIQQK